MSPDEPVTVYKAWNPRQAHLVCQVLANADIEARVASDALEMALGDVPFQQATSPVLVHAADAERARAVLAEFDAHLADRSSEPRDGAGAVLLPLWRSRRQRPIALSAVRRRIGLD